MITLRPYQADGISKIRQAFASGAKAPLYVLPTGGGKTVMFSDIAHSSERRGKRVLIMAHRVELVDQIVESLKAFDVKPDIIASGYSRYVPAARKVRANHPVAVASVQTLVRRLNDYPEPTLIVCDEAHHCAEGNSWSQILRHYSGARVLGVTATPVRLDGRGLGKTFDRLIIGPTVAELTTQGYLAPARIFAPPTVDTSGLHIRAGDYKTDEAEALMDVPTVTGDCLAHYRQHANGLPALVFCTSVKHAHHVAERFRNEGIPAAALDGGTDRGIRRKALADFRAGSIRVLASCEIFSEGLDCPGTHVGIFLRPTASLGLYLQQVGRILRPAETKSYAILLDHVGNTQRFGLPDETREWTLTADVIKKKRKDAISVRICPVCFSACAAGSLMCPEGHVFEVKPRQEVKQKDGELIELTAEEIARKRERREQGRARTLAELEQFAKLKGYHPAWAKKVFEARQRKEA